MKLIGRGSFTRAYYDGDKVYLKSDDYIKECMAFGWFPDSPRFPEVRISTLEGFDYEMEYYPPNRALKRELLKEEYELYRQLRKLMQDAVLPANAYDLYSYWYSVFETLAPTEVREALLEALDACSNCGSDVQFEISPRNVRVKDGK